MSLALKVRKTSPEKASVAGNVVAVGAQAGKSFRQASSSSF